VSRPLMIDSHPIFHIGQGLSYRCRSQGLFPFKYVLALD
jgi:hypothetical protein